MFAPSMLATRNGEPKRNVLRDNIEAATLDDTNIVATCVRLIMSRVGGVLPGVADRVDGLTDT